MQKVLRTTRRLAILYQGLVPLINYKLLRQSLGLILLTQHPQHGWHRKGWTTTSCGRKPMCAWQGE